MPFATVPVFHDTEYGALVSSASRLAPSSWNCTPATPTLSEALALTATVPDTVAPFAGAVRLAVGGVVSGGGALFTVTVTELEVNVSPSRAARATAVRVCVPLPTPAVFHDTEYGALVSSAPRLAPSSLNCTPATVSAPTMLTLALTGTVPDTVDPEAGDVIVTTRLPVGSGGSSCAKARGEIQPATHATTRTAAALFFMVRRPLRSSRVKSRNYVVGINQDPGVRRGRVLAHHLDCQRVVSSGEPVRRVVGVLGSFARSERIEFLDEDTIERYAGDPGLRTAGADPADPCSGEEDGRLRPDGLGFRRRALAVGLVAVVLDPARPIRDGRVGVLMANSRGDHFERIDDDDGVARGRVALARDLDRDRVARLGKTARREDRRLKVLGRRIRIEVARDQRSVDEHVGHSGLRSVGSDPGHRRAGERKVHLGVRLIGKRCYPCAPLPAGVTLHPVRGAEAHAGIGFP